MKPHDALEPGLTGAVPEPAGSAPAADLSDEYFATRLVSDALCKTLQPEDMVAQSMADCSPTKWHLAHTTWFFEQFVLATDPQYRWHEPAYAELFNSYYLQAGRPFPRPQRGLLTRPTCAEVRQYRQAVDAQILELLGDGTLPATLRERIGLGLHHECQHQELMLTDLLHLFSVNPLRPVYRPAPPVVPGEVEPLVFEPVFGGQVEIGAGDSGFSFDNERPVHYRYVPAYALANRPVSNAEYREFIEDGGYSRSEWWLSDGWITLQQEGWRRPLYWAEDLAHHYSLSGLRPLDPDAPVSHVSYYEADAFARWRGARLPREEEWELVGRDCVVEGNFLESGHLTPRPVGMTCDRFLQMFGDVWEWTQSPYTPYPGFRPEPPPLDEYNGKFMSNQIVLRGGSCLSPARHIRATYRNFLPPSARWQMSGIRLAADT